MVIDRIQPSTKVKVEVYDNAGHRCQSCGKWLSFKEGVFHHLLDPSIEATAKYFQFLCPNCHSKAHNIYVTPSGERIVERIRMSKKFIDESDLTCPIDNSTPVKYRVYSCKQALRKRMGFLGCKKKSADRTCLTYVLRERCSHLVMNFKPTRP